METPEKREVGLIILAAGSSVRMKQPKQLMKFENQTLLRRAVETALATVFNPVIVVLGANHERLSNEIEGLNALICRNENFQSGLSSSIKAGLQKLLEIKPEISGVLMTLADQPLITAESLDAFYEKFLVHSGFIIAAEYNEKIGVPALFNRHLFAELLELEGDHGARRILRDHHRSIIKIELPEADLDIDTPGDFLRLTTLNNQIPKIK